MVVLAKAIDAAMHLVDNAKVIGGVILADLLAVHRSGLDYLLAEPTATVATATHIREMSDLTRYEVHSSIRCQGREGLLGPSDAHGAVFPLVLDCRIRERVIASELSELEASRQDGEDDLEMSPDEELGDQWFVKNTV